MPAAPSPTRASAASATSGQRASRAASALPEKEEVGSGRVAIVACIVLVLVMITVIGAISNSKNHVANVKPPDIWASSSPEAVAPSSEVQSQSQPPIQYAPPPIFNSPPTSNYSPPPQRIARPVVVYSCSRCGLSCYVVDTWTTSTLDQWEQTAIGCAPILTAGKCPLSGDGSSHMIDIGFADENSIPAGAKYLDSFDYVNSFFH